MAAKTKMGALRALALTASLGLLLTGCAGKDQALELPEGHAPLPSSAGPSAPAGPSAGAQEQLTTAQLAVASGISMAARLGFDQARVINGQELESLKEAPQDSLNGVVVIPSQCSEVIESLNWSPVQMGGEGARTDFLTDKIAATGSVEVAKVADKPALEKHYGTVLRMLTECKKISLHQESETVPFTTQKPVVKEGQADSAILWTRAKPGQAMRQQALVLVKARGDYVGMVSFIATDGLDSPQFAQMAGEILNAALTQAG
ncbi:hypothetical protein [Paeniglutamicibacter kerguelensis]|uniref:Sensor domain-containing protein n=1 Tax=Paeniglutamicibacter kerguelensis TaxID=254788 RepID=A0ABS4XFI6_9MICC|nr:hypothetical protein [Paeniglutamicibacter kerguelensis]MBP2387225.1 hypothetical protein [Paeniglutamicibacter kerguelensis]